MCPDDACHLQYRLTPKPLLLFIAPFLPPSPSHCHRICLMLPSAAPFAAGPQHSAQGGVKAFMARANGFLHLPSATPTAFGSSLCSQPLTPLRTQRNTSVSWCSVLRTTKANADASYLAALHLSNSTQRMATHTAMTAPATAMPTKHQSIPCSWVGKLQQSGIDSERQNKNLHTDHHNLHQPN